MRFALHRAGKRQRLLSNTGRSQQMFMALNERSSWGLDKSHAAQANDGRSNRSTLRYGPSGLLRTMRFLNPISRVARLGRISKGGVLGSKRFRIHSVSNASVVRPAQHARNLNVHVQSLAPSKTLCVYNWGVASVYCMTPVTRRVIAITTADQSGKR